MFPGNTSDHRLKPLIYDDPETENVVKGITLEDFSIVYYLPDAEGNPPADMPADKNLYDIRSGDYAEGGQVIEVIGEVDWVFAVEEITIPNEEVKTGDDTSVFTYALMVLVAGTAIVLTSRKKETN